MMNRGLACGVPLLLGLALTACGPTATSAPPPETAASASTAPRPTPSPTPTPPTTAEDQAALKKALVTTADLGKPWVQPKSVPSAGNKKNEVCPGHVSAATHLPSRPAASRAFTEGSGTGVNIGSFAMFTLADPSADTAAVRAAYAADTAACAQFKDPAGLFVLRTTEGPTSADSADEMVASWAERVYFDTSHKKLAYARHYVIARSGRVVTKVEYDFLAAKKDPQAKDFGRATRLLDKQLEKAARVFGA